tara:strand:- start:579 stop:1121 length:543 start_codon:yes stop_codon:yes gene_type:complete
MFKLKKLDEQLCSELNAAAIISLHGNNSCDLDTIHKSCFAGEICMYGGSSGPDLNLLRYCDHKYVIVFDNEFCGCIAANICEKRIPNFSNISFPPGSLYIHTLCVESKYRKNGLATQLLDKMKRKNKTLFLTVLNGKNGKRKDLEDFFAKRSQKLLKFYEKQGFHIVSENNQYILLSYKE